MEELGAKPRDIQGQLHRPWSERGLTPGASRSQRAMARPMGLALSCPKGTCNTHMTNLSNHREVTIFTVE